MDSLIFKNTSGAILAVNDLGIYLEISEDLDVLASCRDEDILESTEIESLMTSEDVEIWLNGTTELTYAQVVNYLTKLSKYDNLEELHNHDTRYYTKTELQTSGDASIHWDNISDAPPFGDVNWLDAVDRTDASYGSGTILPVVDNETADTRLVNDDGDGKPAQYICVATTGIWSVQWKKIADIDWGHASAISVTPVGNLASTNIQDALEELQEDIDDNTIPDYVITRNAGLIFTKSGGFVFYRENL